MTKRQEDTSQKSTETEELCTIDFRLEQVRSYPDLLEYFYYPELQAAVLSEIEDKEQG